MTVTDKTRVRTGGGAVGCEIWSTEAIESRGTRAPGGSVARYRV